VALGNESRDGAVNAAGRTERAVGRAVGIRDLAELGLMILAEAAWITVVASLVQEYALRVSIIGIPGFALFVTAGTVVAIRLSGPLGKRWPPVALVLVAAAGFVGCLASPEAREALAVGDLARAIASNPGGWLAALAVLRGFAHANDTVSGDTPESLIGLGVPGIAAAAIIGGAVSDPWRSAFLTEAFLAASVFGVAAALALTVRRLNVMGRETGFDWGPSPVTVALLTAALIWVIVVTGQIAGLIGGSIQIGLATAIGPLAVVGLILGWSRARLRLALSLLLMMGVIVVVALIVGHTSESNQAAPPGSADQPSDSSAAVQLLSLGIGTLAMAGAVVVVLLLLQRWMRSFAAPDSAPVLETRWVDIRPRSRPAIKRIWRRRHDPHDAADAYAALMTDLEPREDVRREAGETPREHAARLRDQRQGALSLDLLAADYVLERFGQATLSERENGRALDRWRRLRGHIGRDGPQRPESRNQRDAPRDGGEGDML
jgi:hypothetical protein